MHIAFKTTYNNGGEGPYIGFADTCSKKNIVNNINNGRVWCSNDQCKCKIYYDNQFRTNPPNNPCMESKLFVNWEYYAGHYHNGQRAGQRINLRQARIGDLCILTTRFPNETEAERKITGLFMVGSLIRQHNNVYGVKAHPHLRVRLLLDEAKVINFWEYYTTNGGIRWGSGLQRYLSDIQVATILFDLLEILQDESNKEIVNEIIRDYFGRFTERPNYQGEL